MRTKSMKLHCRPLELVCAMLKVAYGKTQMRGGRKAVDDLSLEYLIDADLRHRLDKGSVYTLCNEQKHIGHG